MSVRIQLPARFLARLYAPLRRLGARFSTRQRYHPEKHYMRGPGPRFRETREQMSRRDEPR